MQIVAHLAHQLLEACEAPLGGRWHENMVDPADKGAFLLLHPRVIVERVVAGVDVTQRRRRGYLQKDGSGDVSP
jgi:hypothetical protein